MARRNVRIGREVEIQLQYTDRWGATVTVPGTLKNVSASGIGILLEQDPARFLAAGVPVELELHRGRMRQTWHGAARRTGASADGGYWLGIEFSRPFYSAVADLGVKTLIQIRALSAVPDAPPPRAAAVQPRRPVTMENCRRSHQRVDGKNAILVRYVDRRNQIHHFRGVTVDLSATGLGIQMSRAFWGVVAEGTPVRVEIPTEHGPESFCGIIARVIPGAAFVGIEFDRLRYGVLAELDESAAIRVDMHEGTPARAAERFAISVPTAGR